MSTGIARHGPGAGPTDRGTTDPGGVQGEGTGGGTRAVTTSETTIGLSYNVLYGDDTLLHASPCSIQYDSLKRAKPALGTPLSRHKTNQQYEHANT